MLAVIMGNIGFGDRNEFKAVFTNATMLEKGDDVRVAGVNVGEVKDVEHYHRSMALVTFKVDAGVDMTTSSRAEIRFLNLVGDRYLALTAGSDAKDAKALRDGATIPVQNTSPSLDLTTLFDGFKPLFAALTPDQVNEPEHEPGPGPPGRGRHREEPARAHRLADQHAGRPRRADRPGRHQPQAPRSRRSTRGTSKPARWWSSSRTG
ncbi:MlaD family protein [Nocardioides convexus]|uniref:MlaD family protein n=1 Tax=Nocardioides convexus TaxID=2712224 RepID=UPI002418AFE0|nr:MlaD family protein [Nocardioides convexus]